MKANKPLSFQDQIASHYDFIKYCAKKFVSDEDDINDLTQNVVLRAITNEHNFEPETNIKAWLKTIVHNQFINEYRVNKRKGVQIDLTDMLYDVGLYHNSNYNTAIDSFRNEDLKAAINIFSDNRKDIVRLRAMGYRYKEIAIILNIPMGTVRSKLHDAKRKIETLI